MVLAWKVTHTPETELSPGIKLHICGQRMHNTGAKNSKARKVYPVNGTGETG